MPFRELSGVHDKIGLGVDVTIKCNWRCPACFAYLDHSEMTFELFQLCVTQAKDLGFEELYLLGGEPTLHPEIMEMLNLGCRMFDLVILVTNGMRLADPNFCAQVAQTGATIAMQRHTMRDDTRAHRIQNMMTGRTGTLNRVNQAWQNVGQYFAPEKVCVQCCMMQPVVAQGDILEVFKWCRQMGYEPVMEFAKEGKNFRRGCALDLPPGEVLEVLEAMQRIDQNQFPGKAAGFLCPQAYGKTCHMVETSVHCKVNGDIIPCVGHQEMVLGNVQTSSLGEILNHPLRRAIQKPQEWIYGYCRDECPFFEECTGGCRGSAFDQTGCPRASMYYCPHIPHERLSLAEMMPPSCADCPLEGHKACAPKRVIQRPNSLAAGS